MSEDLHIPPVHMDNPEAYTQQTSLDYERLTSVEDFQAASPGYTEGQKKLVDLEARMFGVNPVINPEGFIDAHMRFVNEVESDLQARLPKVKEDVTEKIAGYFEEYPETQNHLKDVLRSRLAATKEVGIYDNLATNYDVVGYFNLFTRQPQLAVSELVLAGATSKSHEEYKEKIEKVILAHEVMHGALTSGIQETEIGEHTPIRNGVEVFYHTNPANIMEDKIIKQGSWLSEATIESFRKDIMDTEEVRYEPAVILLETLDELSPGLRDELILAALDATGPGPVFGKVELLLGPTGIEKVEELLARTKSFTDFAQYKAEVIKIFPKDMQAKANEIFERKEYEIFKNRDWYREGLSKTASPLLDTVLEKPVEN